MAGLLTATSGVNSECSLIEVSNPTTTLFSRGTVPTSSGNEASSGGTTPICRSVAAKEPVVQICNDSAEVDGPSVRGLQSCTAGKTDTTSIAVILCCNTTAASGLYKLIEDVEASSRLFGLGCKPSKSGRILVCAQEHHAGDIATVERLSAGLSKLGYTGLIGRAQQTKKGGTSGGTALLSRNAFPVVPPTPLASGVLTSQADSARLTAGMWGGILPSGILVVTLYLHTGLGLSAPNEALLDQAAELIRAYGVPYIVCGDFQMDPQVLVESGWVAGIKGQVHAGDGSPSMFGYHAETLIDFFIVDQRLEHMVVSSRVLKECGATKPHKPVALMVRTQTCIPPISALRQPCRISSRRPIGCRPKPRDWSADVKAAARMANGHPQAPSLDEVYENWAYHAEREIAALHDICESEKPQYFGRSEELKAVSDHKWHVHRGIAARGEASVWRGLAALLEQYVHALYVRGATRDAHDLYVKLCRYHHGFKLPPAGWHWWRSHAKTLKRYDLDFVRHIHWKVTDKASKIEASEARTRTAAWRKWASKTALEDGGRLAHRWAKGPPPWACPVYSASSGIESRQELAERSARRWHGYWQATKVDGSPAIIPWEELGIDQEEHLVSPSIEEIKHFSCKFPYNTALGCDGFHPRHLGQLTEAALLVLRMLYRGIARHRQLPVKLALLLIVLIPKPTGGDRPIGLFAGVVRVWTKYLFQKYVTPWSKLHPRTYWYGETGKSCELCVWIQSVLAEYASAKGHTYSALLHDLEKAYENVKHSLLIQEAKRFGFPLRVLQLALMLYRVPRRVVLGGVATALVATEQTIVAGCTFATTLLKLTLMHAVDVVVTRHPQAHVAVVVDDITVSAACKQQRETDRIVRDASETLVQQLVAVCDLVVSESKTAFVTNNEGGRSRRRCKVRGPILNRALVYSTKNLGVDFAAGKRCKYTVRSERIKKLVHRVRRCKALRAAGARTTLLTRTGIVPAGTYGVKVTGIPDRQLLQLRRHVRNATVPRTAGRDLTVDLALLGRDVDPAYVCNREPILMWLRCCWDRVVPVEWTAIAFDMAKQEVWGASNPWSKVRGPAGAVIATLKRIGWQPTTVTRWTDETGKEVDILANSPLSIAKLVDRATKIALWTEVAAKHPSLRALASGPLLEPLWKLMHNKGKDPQWNQALAGQLRSLAADGQWPQARLFQAGLVADKHCTLCGMVGTIHHRLWICPACAPFRDQYAAGSPSIQKMLTLGAQATVGSSRAFWCRALAPDNLWQVPEPANDPVIHWAIPGNGVVTGHVCGDGSGMYGHHDRLRRCGWSFCQIDSSGTVLACAYGPLPGWEQDTPLAELWGFLQCLNHALPPVTYHTDCTFVSDGFAKGPEHTAGGGHMYAHVWRQVWKKVDDLGRENVDCTWIKGHSTWNDVLEGVITQWLREGNRAADDSAKLGASLHPDISEHVKRFTFRCQTVIIAAKFIARINAHVMKELPDATPDRRRKPTKERLPRPPRPEVKHGHDITATCQRVFCWTCRRSAKTQELLEARPCRPNAPDDHNLWQVGDHVFCIKCGARSRQRIRLLGKACQQKPTSATKAHELKQLKEGRVPSGRGYTFVAPPLPMSRTGNIERGASGTAMVDDTAGTGELELLLRSAAGE